jgi:hypothetical protein
MYQTQHSSLTALFKVIKEEKLEQFSVLLEDKQLSENNIVQVYNLSRPWVSKTENKE